MIHRLFPCSIAFALVGNSISMAATIAQPILSQEPVSQELVSQELVSQELVSPAIVSQVIHPDVNMPVLVDYADHYQNDYQDDYQDDDSEHDDIIPYLLQDPSQNQVVAVHCHSTSLSRSRQALAAEPSLVLDSSSTSAVIISIQGDCDNLSIQVEQSEQIYRPTWQDFDRDHDSDDPHEHSGRFDWRTRIGSGWYWLMTR